MPFSTVQATDAMTQGHPIITAHAFYRALIHGKDHRVTFRQVEYVWTRLHARALLGENEFAPTEVLPGF
jgi:hypothetical protein